MNHFFKQHLAGLLAAIVISASLFGVLQHLRAGNFADPDGFYHAKASQLLSRGELDDKFPWSYYTTWRDGYADQHYLYHWLIAPFNTIERLHWSVITFGALCGALFYLLLVAMKLRWKGFWLALMLLGSVDFLFRINLVKANTLSLGLLFLIAILVYLWHDRPKSHWLLFWLGTLSALFTWTYGGFVCVPLFIGAYCAAASILNRKVIFAPLLASILGIVGGLAIHPHGNNLVPLMFDQLFRTGLGAGSVVPAGNEWGAFDLDWFIRSNALLLVIWLLSLGISIWAAVKRQKRSWQVLWLQIVAVGFLVLALWHRRFIEYWTPFAVLAGAVTLSPYLAKLSWKEFKTALRSHWQVSIVAVLVVGAIASSLNFNLRHAIGSLRGGESGYAYQAAAQFMRSHSEPGDIVFNTQWDQLPQLFYWNDRNFYLVGLDPTFMYIHDPDLYWQWRLVADDADREWKDINEIHEIVKVKFNSRFVFVENDRNSNLRAVLSEQGAMMFTEVYVDDKVSVYQVN